MSDPLREAIWILRECVDNGLVLGAFSGGKDSIALYRVCEMAGVAPEWHYHVTTIDPPEVVKFIREEYPDVIFDRPKHGNFFIRAKNKNVLPSRKHRWCCDEYKESRGPLNCTWIVGVRREESNARRELPAVGMHKRTRRVHVRPLINWSTEYLWEFMRRQGLKYPTLYDEGFRRLGCVGCPLATRKNREREMARWPKIGERWVSLVKNHYESRVPWKKFNNFEEYYNAWMDGRV